MKGWCSVALWAELPRTGQKVRLRGPVFSKDRIRDKMKTTSKLVVFILLISMRLYDEKMMTKTM